MILGKASELDQIYGLLSRLQSNAINGILLDKYTYRSVYHNMQNGRSSDRYEEQKSLMKFFLQSTVVTNIPDSGKIIQNRKLETQALFLYFHMSISSNY